MAVIERVFYVYGCLINGAILALKRLNGLFVSVKWEAYAGIQGYTQ